MDITRISAENASASVRPSGTETERAQLAQAVTTIRNANIFSPENKMTIVTDPATRRPVLRVVDRNTDELITQLPSEDVLRLAQQLR